jgi:hypothetical protein
MRIVSCNVYFENWSQTLEWESEESNEKSKNSLCPAQIRTGHLPNTNQRRYRLCHLALCSWRTLFPRRRCLGYLFHQKAMNIEDWLRYKGNVRGSVDIILNNFFLFLEFVSLPCQLLLQISLLWLTTVNQFFCLENISGVVFRLFFCGKACWGCIMRSFITCTPRQT